MTKFEIKKEHFECRTERGLEWSEQDIIDAYVSENCHESELVAQAETLEEGLKLFEKESRNARTREEHGYGNKVFITGWIYILEENEYDEDGELDQGSYLEIHAAPYPEAEA